MIRTYRFRIYPDSAQIHILESSLNLSCELYNAMLQQRIYAYTHVNSQVNLPFLHG